MKIIYYIFAFVVLFMIYFLSSLAHDPIYNAIEEAINMGNYRLQTGNPGRNCIMSNKSLKKKGYFIDCMKKNGKLKKVEYIINDDVVSSIYRCEIENSYIGEMRITEHLTEGYDEGYDCSYAIFKKKDDMPVGEAASTYWTP